MELWQMDIMGGVNLQDGHELKIITGIDDHSRFCVCARLCSRATAHPVCEALAAALGRYGVPDQVLTDNGKVFSARFGLVRGEVLFDRILRENGVKHLLTAPHSPTTTGKVERFHKTIRREFLEGRTFTSQEEAQAELDVWIDSYNRERPHQGIGMVPPARRFALAGGEAASVVLVDLGQEADPFERSEPDRHRVQRVVDGTGRIRLVGFHYHVGRYLAGEMVEVEVSTDGLVSIFHREVLVGTHARKHLPEREPDAWKKQPKARRALPKLVGRPVRRKVDPAGCVSFAGTNYRVGNGYRREIVEVRLVGEVVQVLFEGTVIRQHEARHDKEKEHGAFANQVGRPRKLKASS